MNPIRKLLLLCLVFLAIPSPAHAMIELLPAFFAIAGLVIMATVMPVALLLKRLLMRLWFTPGTVLQWKPLLLVTFAETVIMALSVVLCFSPINSMFPPETEEIDVPYAPMLAVLAGASILYSLLAFMPNLWFLNRVQSRSDVGKEPAPRPTAAWLLSLPVPLVLTVWMLALLYQLGCHVKGPM